MAKPLAIWLYGTRVAVVELNARDRLTLTYTEKALDRFPPGTPLLSLSLPLASRRYPQGVVKPFLDGLLPEGNARNQIAADLDLVAGDTYALIRELGRDCAGALVIQPEGEPAPRRPSTETAEPLSEDEVASRIANLRYAPLGVDRRVRISLAGAQEKLLLTRMPDGSWGSPIDGTPSTHILKPEIPGYALSVENEAFCMRFAHHLGLSVAKVETATIGERRVIVVERYDRALHGNGSVERIHQEDLCQAMGIHPDKKYEEDGGPSLRAVAGIVEASTRPNGLDELLRATTVNALIANGDAHGKNFSLLYESSGAFRLAPLYDLMSTLVYKDLDPYLAMYIDSVRTITRVSADRLVNEAIRWGLSKSHAVEVVAEILERVPQAKASAAADLEVVPDNVLEALDSQLAQLRSSFESAEVSVGT